MEGGKFLSPSHYIYNCTRVLLYFQKDSAYFAIAAKLH